MLLRGGDPAFVVTPPPAPPREDVAGNETEAPHVAAPLTGPLAGEDGTARMTLRLPDHLKARVEEAAGQQGISVNAWLVRAISAAFGPGVGSRPVSQPRSGRSYTGWVRCAPLHHSHRPAQRPGSPHQTHEESTAMPVFDTPEPITADIDIVGRVQVTASDRADTVVEVLAADPADEASVQAAEQTTVEFSGGRLLVKRPKLGPLASLIGPRGSVTVTVGLPAGSNVRASSLAGITTTGPLGEAILLSSIGDLQVEEASRARGQGCHRLRHRGPGAQAPPR